MGNFYGKALLIDNNVKFVDGIKEEAKLLVDYPCLISKTFKEATQILKQPKHNIRVIFLSSNLGPTHGLDELKEIKTDRPMVPIILISHNPEREPAEIKEANCGFSKIIRAPKTYADLTKEIDALFTSNLPWTDVEATHEEKNVELNLAVDGYIPTSLFDFVITPKSFFNVFIKLGPSKFIKVFNAGDPIHGDLIQSYSKKGVTHLFISVEEHKKYIRFCEEMCKKILSHQDIASIKKVSNVLNLGASIAQSLIHSGISPEKLDFANTFLNQSLGLIKKMKLKNETLRNFIATIEMKEHNATVSFLAGMIANEVGIESNKAVNLVGVSALLHDIGLYDLDPDFKEENFENLSEEQQNIFDQHQKHGGEILRACGGFDEVVYQAVESHHMRRRGSDPLRRTNNINMVTEIVGAADELHNILIGNQIDDAKFQHFIQNNLQNFSPQIEKAIMKLLTARKAA